MIVWEVHSGGTEFPVAPFPLVLEALRPLERWLSKSRFDQPPHVTLGIFKRDLPRAELFKNLLVGAYHFGIGQCHPLVVSSDEILHGADHVL